MVLVNVEELTIADTVGPAPTAIESVPVGALHVPPDGLQTPKTTALPVQGSSASEEGAGAWMVRTMVDELTTAMEIMFASCTIWLLPFTTPTVVLWVGSVSGTNPEPYSVSVNCWPTVAVGRFDGLAEPSTAVEVPACTVMLKVTVLVLVPHLKLTDPVSALPACASEKGRKGNVTGISVPKLYANPEASAAVMMGAIVPLEVAVNWIGDPLDTAVMVAVGIPCPWTQVRLRTFPSAKLSVAAGLLTTTLIATVVS